MEYMSRIYSNRRGLLAKSSPRIGLHMILANRAHILARLQEPEVTVLTVLLGLPKLTVTLMTERSRRQMQYITNASLFKQHLDNKLTDNR